MDHRPETDRAFGDVSKPWCGTGRSEVALVAAAEARAAALSSADSETLMKLLHPDFTWTTHTGTTLDRAEYVRRNTDGTTRWLGQELADPCHLVLVGDTGVLTCVAVDEIEGSRGPETFRMPMTQVWVQQSGRWVLLAGRAGPRLS